MKNYKLSFILILLLPLGACIFDNDDDEPRSYLFVEGFTQVDGVLISGSEPPSLQIDFPTYRYDEDLHTLNGIIDLRLIKTLNLFSGEANVYREHLVKVVLRGLPEFLKYLSSTIRLKC